MKDVIVRWAKTIGCTAFLGTMIATSSGCGVLGAAANPKVAWAIKDPAPMSVVVRRADVAEKTAQEVDRIMTDTPANDDSPWLAQVAPQQENATKEITALKTQALYQSGARVVPAEVWAKSLAQVEPKQAAKKQPASAPAQEPKPAAPSQPETQVATASEPAEPVAKAAATPEVKKGGKGKKPGSLAKNDKANGARGKKAPLADKAPPAPAEPVSAAPAAPVAPAAPAAAPAAPAPAAAAVSASSAKYPSLLAAIDKDLGTAWSAIMEKKKALGELKAQIASEEAAADAKGVSEADKKAHKKNIEGLEKQADKLEKEAEKLSDEFIPQAKAAAKKAPADVRERFGAVLVNLRQAVDDAGVANGAAAVRYPMAATSLPDSVKTMAAIYVADVIEEKTGKRPSTQGLQPGVTLNGTDVQLTLNGLNQADMGKLSMGELTSEVTARTSAWVKHALGLLGTISSTKEMLSFEDDVLGALIDGFKASGWQPPAATTIPDGSGAAASNGATPAAPAVPSMPRI